MTNNIALARSMLIYAICIPLAIFLGYLITDPLDRTTDYTIAMVFFLLVLPLLLRWYHIWLIVVWNMAISFIFIPGLLPGWMLVGVIAFGVAVGHYVMNRERKFLEARSVSWSLVSIGIVVFVTAMFRGGIGLCALGSETIGGKRYLWIWVAILGYFALVSQRIPEKKRQLYMSLFLLGALTQLFYTVGPHLGPTIPFFSIFFPGLAGGAQTVTSAFATENLERWGSLAQASMAVAFALVARYGLEGVLDLKKLWRPALLAACVVGCGFGGYRTTLIYFVLTLVLVFCFEGLVRSRLMPMAIAGMLLMGGFVVSYSDNLPLPVQRCLAFLPVKINPLARMSAEATTVWRIEIWKYMIPQIPRYLFLGKGLVFDSNDLAMYDTLGDQQATGEVGGSFTLAGDYHSGPLSLIIPFGIWGVLAFFWFLGASIKVLWRNYKYGDPEMKTINTFLLSYFIAKAFIYFIVFGGFCSDLFVFVGTVGINISLNGGVAKPVPATVRPQVVFNRFRPLPAAAPVPALKQG
jgi:hypothetical protein